MKIIAFIKTLLFSGLIFVFASCSQSNKSEGKDINKSEIKEAPTSSAEVQTPNSTLNAIQNIAGEIIKNQKSRVKDKYGAGQYGASRDGGTRKHKGLDIIASVNEKVYAPFNGVITREVVPYANDSSYKGIVIKGKGDWDGYEIKIFYVEGLLSGNVQVGQEIGFVQNLTLKYPSITNHIHIEVKKQNTQMDPFEIWQYSF